MNIHFAPTDDISYPIRTNEAGVLAVYCDPTVGVKTIRFEKDLKIIFNYLRSTSMVMTTLVEHKVGKYTIYSCTDHANTHETPVLYKGRIQHIRGPCIICKDDMSSLTMDEAFNLISTTKLMPLNGDMNICINILDDYNAATGLQD